MEFILERNGNRVKVSGKDNAIICKLTGGKVCFLYVRIQATAEARAWMYEARTLAEAELRKPTGSS